MFHIEPEAQAAPDAPNTLNNYAVMDDEGNGYHTLSRLKASVMAVILNEKILAALDPNMKVLYYASMGNDDITQDYRYIMVDEIESLAQAIQDIRASIDDIHKTLARMHYSML